MQALEGIKIIDFSKWLPGQYCGMVLGDFGADVIKVEDVKGDVTRGLFNVPLPVSDRKENINTCLRMTLML